MDGVLANAGYGFVYVKTVRTVSLPVAVCGIPVSDIVMLFAPQSYISIEYRELIFPIHF